MRKLFLMMTCSVLATSLAGAVDDNFLKAPTKATEDELNAIALLRNTTDGVFFSKTAVEQIANEIATIKAQYPEVKDVNDFYASPHSYSSGLLSLRDDTLEDMMGAIRAAANVSEPVTKYTYGNVEVSALLDVFVDIQKIKKLAPVQAIQASYSVGPNTSFNVSFFEIEFGALLNIRALAQQAGPFKHIEYLEADGLMGDGNHIRRKVIDAKTVEYTFSLGSGDCPAGCTVWRNLHFRLNTVTGEVTKTGEDGGFPGSDW